MFKRLEPLANLAILFTCVLVCGFVLRDRILARAGAVNAPATTPSPAPNTRQRPGPLGELGPAMAVVPADGSNNGKPVATLEGGVILAEELEAVVAPQMLAVRSQEYTIRRAALDQAIDRILLDREVQRRGVSIDELAQIEITAKTEPVTASAIEEVYRNSASRFATVTAPQAHLLIENELTQSRLTARRKSFVRELRDKAGVHIFLEPIRVDVESGGAPSRGPKNAPITIVEFADFQCPYCSRTQATLRQLEEGYPDKIRIVYKHFPLPIHQDAPVAAEAADCAADQGRFWQMQDLLYTTKSFKTSDLSRLARQSGADVSEFDSCLMSGKHATAWRRHKSDGERYGVTSTPTFFINGRSLVGAQPIDAFMEVIDEELERVEGRRTNKTL